MPETLTFNLNRVTTRMLIDFKDKTGVSLMSLFEGDDDLDFGSLDETVLAGFIWLALRISRPDATWDDALDMPFTSLSFAEAEEPDPTNAGSVS